MHCLFLGITKWIVTKLWIGKCILNDEKLKIMQKRADMIKITSDLERCPVRIVIGDGFSNFTAYVENLYNDFCDTCYLGFPRRNRSKNPCIFYACLYNTNKLG